MMRSTFASIFTLLVVIATVFTSCRKDDFDNPPAGGTDPNLVANTTIAQLKQGYVFGQYDTIKTDVIISGIVTADDKSGNFYKTIVIQDATAAIAIRLDVSDYYTRYPIGRRIFVKCKNLIIGDYNNLIQLGGFIDNSVPSQPSVEPIPYTLVDKFIFPGQYNLAVSPTVVTIPDLLANPLQYQNMLVRLNQVEFASSDTGLTYADVVLQQSANRKLKDCSNNTIELRTSNYATFAGQNLPNGNGSITTIFSVFGSSPQMYIRDLNDVKLDSARCGSNPNPGGAINENFSSQTSGTDISINGWYNINAVGDRYWRAGSFSGDTYAQATAFGSSLSNMEAWLITPGFNLATIDTLSFRSSWGFFVHNGLSVWIATNFNGTNVATANWTQLNCTLAVQADGQYVWVPSGNVPLTSFSGTGHIGFKYVGNGTTNTTTWRIDDVVIH
jgi:hypothetical protein